MDKAKFMDGIGRLLLAFPDGNPGDLDKQDARIELYFEALKADLNDAQWDRAVKVALAGRFFPRIGDLLDSRTGSSPVTQGYSPRYTGPPATREEIREILADPRYRAKAITFLRERVPARLPSETDEQYARHCARMAEWAETAIADDAPFAIPGVPVP